MPYCPKCEVEYEKGTTQCKDCGEELIERLPQNKFDENETEALLTEVNNEIDAQMIMNTLQNAGIPCLRKYISNGDMMKIYGFVNFGSKIYVPSQVLEQAQELIHFEPIELDDATYEEPVETPLFKKDIWFNIIFWLLAGITIVSCILAFTSH